VPLASVQKFVVTCTEIVTASLGDSTILLRKNAENSLRIAAATAWLARNLPRKPQIGRTTSRRGIMNSFLAAELLCKH
jgi:hypothetical protein